MKFNAVNNKESCYVLSVSGQCGGSSAVSLACSISMCFVQRFPAASLFVLAFGSFFLFFYPHPSSPFLFPLINQCDKCLARIYQGLACSRRSVSRVRCSDDGERVKSYAEETRGRKWGDSGANSLPFPFSLPFFFFVNFSTALYYLNAWNRLTRGWLCQNWKPLDKPGTHLH